MIKNRIKEIYYGCKKRQGTKKGDSKSFVFIVYTDKAKTTLKDISGYIFKFTLKKNRDDAQADAKIKNSVTVGDGGATNVNGENSVFSTITALGGGGGGGYPEADGSDGGSGGGARHSAEAGTGSQGGDGGTGYSSGVGGQPFYWWWWWRSWRNS